MLWVACFIAWWSENVINNVLLVVLLYPIFLSRFHGYLKRICTLLKYFSLFFKTGVFMQFSCCFLQFSLHILMDCYKALWHFQYRMCPYKVIFSLYSILFSYRYDYSWVVLELTLCLVCLYQSLFTLCHFILGEPLVKCMHVFKGAWLARSVDHVTLDFTVVSSSPILGVKITLNHIKQWLNDFVFLILIENLAVKFF